MSSESDEVWAEVAVPVPLRFTLTYLVPTPWHDEVKPGQRVLVHVGPRRMTGVVISVGPAAGERPEKLRPLLEVLDSEPLISEELVSFVLRAAEYYLFPPGEALRAALPPAMTGAERQGAMPKVRAEPATVECARLAQPLPGDPRQALRRAPARARLLARLPEDRSEVPLTELRRFHSRATQLLRALADGGWVEFTRRPPPPDPLLMPLTTERSEPPVLTDDQRAALEVLDEALAQPGYRGFLLHGVTGSGKTEIYLQAIEGELRRGRTALVLVPEIALTPQLVSRFRSRLGRQIGVLHSGLTQAQRLREWSRLQAGEAKVAIGARSAVFAPVRELGIVVVDEEHDASFKQDDGFRYNGRDLALLRARRAGAVAVLGSATPSLESYYNAQQGRLELLRLPARVTPQPLPTVEAVDLRRHRSGPGGQSVFTLPMVEALKEALTDGQQAILFLNRRGYSPVAICRSCGEPVRCRACSVSMTFHQRTALLECHYCSHAEVVPERCPGCGAVAIELLGAGTERAEELLGQLLGEQARVGRLDSDVAPGRGSEAVIDRVRQGETNVLVGTQLVTKGHDLPGVSLVGVLSADATLHFPDFRATERTFQLLTQVAGRAGRGQREGRVVVQTFMPSHPVIRLSAVHDYESFYRWEMTSRQELGYPPVARLSAVRLSGRQEPRVRDEAERIAAAARALPEVRSGQVQIRGPAPAPIALIRERFRYRLLLKAARRKPLRLALSRLIEKVDKVRFGVRASFDVDPVHML